MTLDDRTRIALPLILKITAIGAAFGAIDGYFSAPAGGEAGLYGIARGLLTGGLIACILSSFHALVLRTPIGAPLVRAPCLLGLAVKLLIYLVVFVLGAEVGVLLIPNPASTGGLQISLLDIGFGLAVVFVVTFLVDVNSLLGQNVLLDFVTGRYYRPRVEQRIFLFIDMKHSTAAAERLGDVDFHRLINRFIGDLTGAIVLHAGQLHKYVGDELIATWPMAKGLKDARCLQACFGAIEHLAALGPSYERDFGLRVELRAGLHCGSVVVGEMGGIVKKEIALIGDALNTAARIVDACRDKGEQVIASAALLQQLNVPAGMAARPLGPVPLRGKKEPVELFALAVAP